MKPKKPTDEQRRAVQAAEARGRTAAAKQFGVTPGTITRWRRIVRDWDEDTMGQWADSFARARAKDIGRD
jgi:transposase